MRASRAEPPALSPVDVIPTASSPSRDSHWSKVITSTMGISKRPIPRKSRARCTYIRADAARIWPHARRLPMRNGATGVHVARTTTSTTRPITAASTRPSQRDSAAGGSMRGSLSRRRCRRGRSRRSRRGQRPGRIRAVVPALGPLDRTGPLCLQVRARRPVEEGGLELAPPPFEVDPRERFLRGRRLRGDRHDLRAELATLRPRVSSQPTPASAELPR